MGFSGVEVLARSTVDVAKTDAVEEWYAEVLARQDGPDGWQWLQLGGTETLGHQCAVDLESEIDGAVLLANYLDSDFAVVIAAVPCGATFDFFLRPRAAVGGYEMPVDPTAQAAAPERLVAWAGTDPAPDPAAVRDALTDERLFAEEVLFALAVALGALPPAEAGDVGD